MLSGARMQILQILPGMMQYIYIVPHLAKALHELVVEGGELTRRLLGAASAERPRDTCW